MKLFRDLLLESPDTVYYKRKMYGYRSPANKCAFLVYKDEKSGKNAIFGYSYEKDFYCDDAEVLKDVDELSKQASIKLDTDMNSDNQLYWAQRAITNLKNGNSGGGHLDIENLLKGIGRFGAYADPLLKGRIFEVFDDKDVVDDSDLKIESAIPSGKGIIVTFWDSERKEIANYKDQYDKVIEFNGYDPKECLYEPQMNFYTYDNFYNDGPSISEKPSQTTTSNTTDTAPWSTQTTGESENFKVGDIVRLKGLKDVVGDVTHIDGDYVTVNITSSKYSLGPFRQGRDIKQLASGMERVQSVAGTKASDSFSVGDKVKVKGMNVYGEVLSINAANNIKLKVTKSDLRTVPVGSEFDFPYYGLESDDTVAASDKLDKVIHNKNKELVDKSGKLHSEKTVGKNDDKPPTPEEKAKLEKEVNGLEFEIKILNDLLASGEKYYTDNVKDVVATSVQRKLHALEKEKKNRYSLIAQAEKQYGMPIAQIRQKYRNVPLDQLVKKESLYKKLLKTLRG
jgi:exosome complex RNA-binding protein Csl4